MTTYESLSTLAHEWGHAMHTLYSKQNQPFDTSFYSTFIAEIPSTSLELILQDYMSEKAESDNERLFYLGSALEGMRGTFFRQTMFAEFELSLYEAAERGEALSGERISEMYGEILKRYHGHDEGVVVIDDLYTNEWMFIPHFLLQHVCLSVRDVANGRNRAVRPHRRRRRDGCRELQEPPAKRAALTIRIRC